MVTSYDGVSRLFDVNALVMAAPTLLRVKFIVVIIISTVGKIEEKFNTTMQKKYTKNIMVCLLQCIFNTVTVIVFFMYKCVIICEVLGYKFGNNIITIHYIPLPNVFGEEKLYTSNMDLISVFFMIATCQSLQSFI